MSTQYAFDARRASAPGSVIQPDAHLHGVHFYGEDKSLIKELGLFMGNAARTGDSCVVIATQEHRDVLSRELTARGIDVPKATREGRYLAMDAATTLAACSWDGHPHPVRFQEVVGGTVDRALRAATGSRKKVAAFGEMVALLWEQGNAEAALRLEQFWNDLIRVHPALSLRCGYPLAGFDRAGHSRIFEKICAEHSHVLPAESYSALSTEDDRLRAISALQQKAQALEAEVAVRKRVEEALRISEERLRLTQKAAGIGCWELDLETDACILSEEAAAMLGLMHGSGTSADLLGCMYYSGDRDNFESCLKLAARKSRDFEAEFRLTRSGEVRWICARGKTFYNQGRPLLLGVLIDITAVKLAQGRRASRKNNKASRSGAPRSGEFS
jgi:PAS domain S-box-containing protein